MISYNWGLWNQDISIGQIKQDGCVLSWSAKWLDKKKVHSRSRRDKDMLTEIHSLLTEADAVIHYNGVAFDIKWLNGEFVRHGITPPAPGKQIDLLKVVKRNFKFPSNKLEYVAKALNIGHKFGDMAFKDWIGCMEGDEASWNKMIKYNKSDVTLTEKLYKRLLPWIYNHPNVTLYEDKHDGVSCITCGSKNYRPRGKYANNAGLYNRYSCNDCGTWFRGCKKVSPKLETARVV